MTQREGFFSAEPAGEAAPPRRRVPVLRRPIGPSRHPVRVVVLAVILAVAIGVGLIDHAVGRPSVARAPAVVVSAVPAADVESSAWYCAGGTSAPGSTAATTLDLTNTTGRPVEAAIRAVSDTGHTANATVAVPPHGESTEVPGPLVGGSWVAATVSLPGGGVLVSESVAGLLGWSESPCSRSTASSWYFASGATEKGDTLALALYNPTTTEAVVDTTFVVPAGISQPQPFEGIVVPAGALVTEQIDSLVQDASSVSSIVSVRSGAIVAAELETRSGGVRGVSLRYGVPSVGGQWVLPRSVDIAGGVTTLSVFNPTQGTDSVAVTVRPGISPPASFTHLIGPESTWVFDTSAEPRIPTGLPFLAVVSVRRGPGVVVDRTMTAPASAPGPQFGTLTAVATSSSAAVFPGPGTAAHPAVASAAIDALDLVNPTHDTLRVRVVALAGAPGVVPVATVRVPAFSTLSIGPGSGNARLPVVVAASGRVAVTEDLTPSAADGVVSVAGAAGDPG